jgi:serine phosphatase RsbU (regulator of sigma subunit)
MHILSPEEKKILDTHNTFWQGLAKRDLDMRFSVVSPDVTFFGTGKYERAVGIEKYREMNQEGIDQYPDKYIIQILWHDIRIFGDLAWVECDTLWIKNVEEKIIKDNIRITTIFKKENNKWWVIHVHGSNPDYRLKEGEHTIDANVFRRNRELERQVFERTKELETEKKEVEKQKQLIEEKNKEITSSIQYALRIQTAILLPSRIVKKYLADSFIVYIPKDIIAGDFYWIETIDDLVLFAACDSTGHGVPGAMVSVVCHNALNRAVREFNLFKPSDILDKTAKIVFESFSKSEDEIKDGMDVSLCVLNTKTKTLEWAGAKNPLWLIKNGEFTEAKADKQSIGITEVVQPFTNHQFRLNKGDNIYIFSDGFADQFGGEDKSKLNRKRFKELIKSNQHLPLHDQGVALEKFMTGFRKNTGQTDDILVMGVKV